MRTREFAVTARLNAELGTAFIGRSMVNLQWTFPVDRAVQWRAITAHASQATHNSVLARLLNLPGNTEHLRQLTRLG